MHTMTAPLRPPAVSGRTHPRTGVADERRPLRAFLRGG